MVSLSNRYVTPWGPLFCRLKFLVLTARALSCEFHEVSRSLNPIFGSTFPVLVTWFTLAAEFFVWSPFRRLSYCESVLWPEQKVRLLCPPQWPPACGLRGQSKSRCAASVSHMPRPKECKIRVSFGWIPPASFSSFPTWSLGNFKLQISLGSSEVKKAPGCVASTLHGAESVVGALRGQLVSPPAAERDSGNANSYSCFKVSLRMFCSMCEMGPVDATGHTLPTRRYSYRPGDGFPGGTGHQTCW